MTKKDAISHFEKGDFLKEKLDSATLKWHLKFALQGDRNSQRKLSNLYRFGIGVEKDESKALFWGDAVGRDPEVIQSSWSKICRKDVEACATNLKGEIEK